MITNKKIIITTVYNSENCGSFLQAWSLYNVLERKGYKVAFLRRETKKTSHSFRLHLLNATKDIVKLRLSHAFHVIKEWLVFEKLHRQFRIVKNNSSFYNEASIQVIGSDTLWNFDDGYFRKMVNTYMGQDFSPKPSITYAISAANTSESLFYNTTRECIDKICVRKYLVRDTHTSDLVRSAFKVESEIVCDPTMLLTPSDFGSLEKTKPAIGDYLLIYCFGDITPMKDAIISYAKKRGLKTVSFMSKREWCDYSIEEDPRLMVTYYHHAECVVANTFHGTALSIIYEKPFAVLDEGKNKVKELLQMYGHEDRLINSPESLNNCLDTEISGQDKHKYESIKNQSLALLLNTIYDETNRKD